MGDILGRIEIVVMRDGKLPANVEGLNDFQVVNSLSSLLKHVNARMANKPMLLDENTKKRLYENLMHIFGGEDGFPIINAMAWCINRVSAKMARDKRVETDLIMDLKPEVLLKS